MPDFIKVERASNHEYINYLQTLLDDGEAEAIALLLFVFSQKNISSYFFFNVL